ncbi:hypothetical protein [Sphingobium herbicidovorans]|uniref:hypothetical protein n=1 Tax=Sphingobium herbicidovorans TaxID=76947 RepID=UPI0009DA5B10|nr:hypothetical protein [Sphingobium herbicidovorans]
MTFDAGSRTGYICRINKARYFANRRRFKIVMKQLLDNYAAQKEAYRRSGQSMTTQDAWERRFKIVNARGIDERDLSAA